MGKLGFGDPSKSDLWKAVQTWRNDSESWIEAAESRLSETLRVNPLREDQAWVREILHSLGGNLLIGYPRVEVDKVGLCLGQEGSGHQTMQKYCFVPYMILVE